MADERERDSEGSSGEGAGIWRWIFVPLTIFSILALIIVGLWVGAGIYVKKKSLAGMSPAEIKEYEEWVSKKLTFDPADLEAPPAPVP